ncbi:MAG: TAXI family TRAP transporter solute-binding subunit [Candidatus Wallbacteria bacterium]|nr:TAXI family TRAP transporter solute-binding subunit [Candidatus Wallbacteria bacterium]
MNKGVCWIFAGVLFLSFCCRAEEPVSPVLSKRFYSIGTASIGGTYYPLGIAFSKLFNSNFSDLLTLVEPTFGSVANVFYIESGDLDFAFVQSDVMHDAVSGIGNFSRRKSKHLKAVISLYPEIVHVVVHADSGIHRLEDLSGRTVVPGAKGSGSAVNAEFLLKNLFRDEEYTTVYMDFTKAVDALNNKAVDAVFWTGGIPGEAIEMLARKTPVRVLSFTDDKLHSITSKYSFYCVETIPPGTYTAQNYEVRSLALRAVLAVRDNVPSDLVGRILEQVFQNIEYLAALHPRANDIKLENALKGIQPELLHEGAKKYYSSKGFW